MREAHAQGAIEGTREANVVSYTMFMAGLLKNGMPEDAVRLFRRMPERDVVSWNAMISECSQAGLSEEAVTLFHQMCRESCHSPACSLPLPTLVPSAYVVRSVHASAIKPDNVTLLGLLFGCNLVDEGYALFKATWHTEASSLCLCSRSTIPVQAI
jgi:pentatricopeptide repeat protein